MCAVVSCRYHVSTGFFYKHLVTFVTFCQHSHFLANCHYILGFVTTEKILVGSIPLLDQLHQWEEKNIEKSWSTVKL